MTLVKPTRRDLLKLAAAVPAFAMPLAAKAQLGPPQGDNPAHFRFSIGEARLTILSDGFFTTATSGLGVNAPPEEVQAFLAQPARDECHELGVVVDDQHLRSDHGCSSSVYAGPFGATCRKLKGLPAARSSASDLDTTSYGTAATAAADSGVGRSA